MLVTSLFSSLLLLFIYHSSNLLLTLLALEILSFFLIFFVSVFLASSQGSDFILVTFFVVFVIEGVIALSSLLSLVSFVGSDYVSSFSFILCS